MNTIAVRTSGNRLAASPQTLASDYKWRRLDRHLAWDQFVIDRNLKPEMNAKEFYTMFDDAYAVPFYEVADVSFQPTHIDTLAGLNVSCQAIFDGKLFVMLWANGMTGTEFAPLSERFVPIGEVAS